ncbi:hypothetical protein J7X65_001029 [Vibrio parahaemolyticus]|uniref:hypothetical protein n=1 Tax=Vibrio diabolicus TaxID=50719 RepID=UPI00215FD0A3|nr:hypothetical protein [Vibrio diabolicus]EHH2490390.1 hypothetical protein [Vibrio parahaemolyticus]MCS0342742.1 hypothetical protein [Vibrio diabolicus]
MLTQQDIGVLLEASKALNSAFQNTAAKSDPVEITSWHARLAHISESLKYLVHSYHDQTLEQQYYNLSDIYLITNDLTISAIFSMNERFGTFRRLSKEFNKLVGDKLTTLGILLNRQKIEQEDIESVREQLNDCVEESKRQIDEHTVELKKRLSDAVTQLQDTNKSNNADIISYIQDSKKEIRQEISQIESESINRIMVAGQGVEKTIESGSRQLDQIKESLDSISDHELNNIRQSIHEVQRRALENIRTASSDISSSFQDHLSETIDSFDKHYNSKISGINKRIDHEVSAFEAKRSDMDALLEKVGIAQDADVTITQANKELKSATWLRWTGLGFMCCSIALLIYFFRYYIGFSDVPEGVTLPDLKDLGFEFFALRFMTVILVSSPAIYLLKESAAHRAKENLYRQRGTQLLTIRGYLADLSDEQRSEVKHKLAENFFSFHNGKVDTSNVPDFIKNMNEAVKLAHAIKTPSANESDKNKSSS